MTIVKNNIPKQKRNNETQSNSHGAYSGSSDAVIINNGVKVVNNLNSDSSTEALSAKQGKVLNKSKLSKNEADTAHEIITFEKGIATNGEIKTTDYDSDRGASLHQDGSKNWTFVIDNLKVRKHLEVQELTIEEAKHVGGALYCTHASLTISKVQQLSNSFRCWFKKEDANGNVIYNQFRQGDMALCQTFNNNQARRWWRGVSRVGSDYIDVTINACEQGSSIPSVGDEVVQFGSATDPSRMGAVIIEPLALKVYDNINTFVMPTPKLILSPKGTKIDADSINFLGKTVINDKFIVAENGDVTLNNATITGDLNLKLLRIYANQVDEQGRLLSSFINKSGTYKLPQLQPNEVRTCKIIMGRPSRTTVEPVRLVKENPSVHIGIQDVNVFHPNVETCEISDSMWEAYGMGREGGTDWIVSIVTKFT